MSPDDSAETRQKDAGVRFASALRMSLVVVLALAVAAPQKVAVIKSQDHAIYNLTLAGFKARVKTPTVLGEFTLKPEDKDALSRFAPDVIFAIGPSAVKLAQASFADVPLVYAAVP